MALIDYLLPIIALLFGVIPINLNGLDFILFYFQLYFIAQVIRFYHQKWYYSEHEKGTAILGGILFKASWWTTLLGFIFSTIKKKVPFIPTPKDFKLETPWKLLLPNFIIIALSIVAIVFGLIHDLTPPSLFMAFLALLNIMILSLGSFMAMQKQIVFLHRLFKGTFISKGSSTRIFAFKVKHTIYNLLSKNFAVASSLLIILLLNFIILIVSPKLHYGLLNPGYIKQKISHIIGNNDKLFDRKNYGQLYIGKSWQDSLKYSHTNVSFVKGDFYLNRENNISIENFLDSCYSNNILPFISLSVDTTKGKTLPNNGNILTLEKVFKEVKSRYLPVILMFDRNLNDVSDEFYADFYMNAYSMAESMAIHLLVTWVWHSNALADDYFLNYYEYTINWIYSEKEDAYVYNNAYYGLNRNKIDLPLLVDASNVHNLNSVDFKKSNYERNIVGILGAQATKDDKLKYNLKEVFKKPDKQEISRLSLPKYVKGIAYNPGTGGGNSDQLPLTIDKLTKDFELIDKTGSNTIRRFSASIYDYNLLRVAKKFDLDVLYGFWFDWELDYHTDSKNLKNLKNRVLNHVQRHKADSSIVSWGLGNETWVQLSHNFGQPYLSVVRNSYLKFLRGLVNEIKQIDNTRPVYSAETQNPASMYSFAEYVPQIDFFGINTYYEENVSLLKGLAQHNLEGIPYLVSEYGNDGYWSEVYNDFNENKRVLEQSSMKKANEIETIWNKYIFSEKEHNLGGVAFCWQDRFECTATWFGVLDIFGNKKPAYYALKDAYSDKQQNTWVNQFPLPEFKISINSGDRLRNIIYADAIAEKEKATDNYQFKWIIYTDYDFEKIKETDFEYGANSFSFILPKKEKPYRIYLYVKDDLGNVVTESLPIQSKR